MTDLFTIAVPAESRTHVSPADVERICAELTAKHGPAGLSVTREQVAPFVPPTAAHGNPPTVHVATEFAVATDETATPDARRRAVRRLRAAYRMTPDAFTPALLTRIRAVADALDPNPEAHALPTAVAATAAPTTRVEGGLVVDAWGEARANRDEAIAEANGFAVPRPLFATGTRVNETGVANARRFRNEWLAMPTMIEACATLVREVEAEQRTDEEVHLNGLAMADTGELVRADKSRIHLASRAFRQLTQRLGCGGAEYLEKACWAELRAHNVNAQLGARRADFAEEVAAWRETLAEEGPKAAGDAPGEQVVVLRTRNHPLQQREVFALVSDRYQKEFGVDAVATAIAAASPVEARGTIDYDGNRAKWSILWHSDVKAEDYVAGEIFRAGVIVKADDTGAGGISVSAVVHRNLCLNLIILAKTEQTIASIRHVGDIDRVRDAFAHAFEQALSTIDGFRKVWGAASRENAVDAIRRAHADETKGLTLEQLIPGIFNATIEREKIPVRLRRKDAVPLLVQKFYKDEIDRERGFTRSAVVNAFTRFAHEELQDPWQQDELERAAGALLLPKPGRKTLDALPWAPLSMV